MSRGVKISVKLRRQLPLDVYNTNVKMISAQTYGRWLCAL